MAQLQPDMGPVAMNDPRLSGDPVVDLGAILAGQDDFLPAGRASHKRSHSGFFNSGVALVIFVRPVADSSADFGGS